MNIKQYNMKMQEYLTMSAKFENMKKSIDVWAIDYQMEKLKPLVDAGYDYNDISNFLLTRFDKFVHGGKLDELLELDKLK